jgi:hypothetical protein
VAVGEHAIAGALRYFARSDLKGERAAAAVARRYLKAAYVTAFAVRNLFDKYPFRAVCVQQGLYVPQGIVAEVARTMDCRLAAWRQNRRVACWRPTLRWPARAATMETNRRLL